MTPFLFLKAQEKKHLQQKLETCFSSWVGDWCSIRSKMSVEYFIDNESKFLDPLANGYSVNFFVGATQSDQAISVFTNLNVARHLLNRASREVPNDKISAELRLRAVQDLVGRIGKLGADKMVAADHRDRSDYSTYSEALQPFGFNLAFGDLEVSVSINTALMSALIGRSISADPLMLTNKLNAVAERGCELSVDLELGSFRVSEIKDLAVGDILSTSVPLVTPFAIKINTKVVADANLVKLSKNKAVVLSESRSD